MKAYEPFGMIARTIKALQTSMKQSISKVMVLVTVIMMDLLAGMEFDQFVPSFPELQARFNLTPFWVEALLSVNFIGFGISLFLLAALLTITAESRLSCWG